MPKQTNVTATEAKFGNGRVNFNEITVGSWFLFSDHLWHKISDESAIATPGFGRFAKFSQTEQVTPVGTVKILYEV